MTQNPNTTFSKQDWMSHITDIDHLTLSEIVWPGAHNAGMDLKAPDHGALVGIWMSCQDDSFAWQLANGARALDLRLVYDSAAAPPAFIFHHNGERSGRTLDEMISAVIAFLDAHPDEFILLDFHELGYEGRAFDYVKFRTLLVSRLGNRIIPRSSRDKTLGELKSASSKQRVILAAPAKRELDDDYFWERIHHRWSGEDIIDEDELKQFISKTLASLDSGAMLWSLSATTYSILSGPQRIKDSIDDWFDPARHWISRCSIINVDFFDDSNIVRYCWRATRTKASYGEAFYQRLSAE